MLSEKQKAFMRDSGAFLNIADGAVRSGKTHSALHRLSRMAITGPPGDLIVVGKTERTAKRNVVLPLQEMHPKGAVRYVQGAGELYLFGRRCWVIGANDARAEEKVRGLTAAGGYVNEWTLVPREFTLQLIDRCSVDGAQLLGDTNPDSPYHYLMSEFIGAGLPERDLMRLQFSLHDNPVLGREYIERLDRMHAPGTLWHRRMVLGEWVVAEGAVYDMLDAAPGGAHVVTEIPERFERVVVGVDYGTSNPTVFLAAGLSRVQGADPRSPRVPVWTVFREERYDGRAGRQRTDAEHSLAFTRFVEGLGYAPSSVEVDPSAASFIAQLRKDNVRRIRQADNSVLDGIRVVSTALTSGTLKIHQSCEGLLSEMSTYAWDSKAQEKGEDKPLKVSDHGPDALRYLAMRVLNRPALAVVRRDARL